MGLYGKNKFSKDAKKPARPYIGGLDAKEKKGATPRSYETHPSVAKDHTGKGTPKVANIKGLKVR